jgi:hypothetical protein
LEDAIMNQSAAKRLVELEQAVKQAEKQFLLASNEMWRVAGKLGKFKARQASKQKEKEDVHK